MLNVELSRTDDRDTTRTGILFGIAAYGFWGIIAVYFKWVREVVPAEILAHRIVWSAVMLAAALTILRRWPALAAVLRDRRALAYLGVTTVVIAVNWFLFIWAVTHDRMMEASLGYFINPLVNVLLGWIVLREQLRRWEWVSVGVAATGVLWLAVGSGVVPWISLVLATSFGLYGLLRKMAGVGAIEGLAVETALLSPIAAGYLLFRAQQGTIAFGTRSVPLDLLLLAAGPVTALPLLWFAAAVRRLRLATIGLLQYLSPSLQFLLATVVYGEPLSRARLAAFVLIWIAIAVYSTENYRHHRGPAVVAPE